MSTIRYTEEFKKKVRKLHGNSFNDYLEQGSPALKMRLQSFPTTVSLDEISNAKTLKDLKLKAKLIKDNLQLISDWWGQPGV